MSFAGKATNHIQVAFLGSDEKKGSCVICSCMIHISMSFAGKVTNHIQVAWAAMKRVVDPLFVLA